MGLIDKDLVLNILEKSEDKVECIRKIKTLTDISTPEFTKFKFKSKDLLTDSEKILYGEMLEDGDKPECIFDCPLPKNEQKILIKQKDKIFLTTFYNEKKYGCFIDEGNIIDETMSWMGLPN